MVICEIRKNNDKDYLMNMKEFQSENGIYEDELRNTDLFQISDIRRDDILVKLRANLTIV